MAQRKTKRKFIVIRGITADHAKQLYRLGDIICFYCEDLHGFGRKHKKADATGWGGWLHELRGIFAVYEPELWTKSKTIPTTGIRTMGNSALERLYIGLHRLHDYNRHTPSEYIKRWDNPPVSFMRLIVAIREALEEIGPRKQRIKKTPRYNCSDNCGHLIGPDSEHVCGCGGKFHITCIIEHRINCKEKDGKKNVRKKG